MTIIHSGHDQRVHPAGIEWSAARNPGCRVIWLDGSGHMPMLEEPDRFSQALAECADQP